MNWLAARFFFLTSFHQTLKFGAGQFFPYLLVDGKCLDNHCPTTLLCLLEFGAALELVNISDRDTAESSQLLSLFKALLHFQQLRH